VRGSSEARSAYALGQHVNSDCLMDVGEVFSGMIRFSLHCEHPIQRQIAIVTFKRFVVAGRIGVQIQKSWVGRELGYCLIRARGLQSSNSTSPLVFPAINVSWWLMIASQGALPSRNNRKELDSCLPAASAATGFFVCTAVAASSSPPV